MCPHFIVEPWHWWMLGSILIVLEILVPQIFLIWVGTAALIVGTVHHFEPFMPVSNLVLLWLLLSLGVSGLAVQLGYVVKIKRSSQKKNHASGTLAGISAARPTPSSEKISISSKGTKAKEAAPKKLAAGALKPKALIKLKPQASGASSKKPKPSASKAIAPKGPAPKTSKGSSSKKPTKPKK